MTEHVVVNDEAGIRTIRMNRPEKKNALTLAMYDAMTDALESASTNDAVRCVRYLPACLAPSRRATISPIFSRQRKALAGGARRRCASCPPLFTAESRSLRQ